MKVKKCVSYTWSDVVSSEFLVSPENMKAKERYQKPAKNFKPIRSVWK